MTYNKCAYCITMWRYINKLFLIASVVIIVAYHLPNLENDIFRHTTDHPGLIIPSEVRNLYSMATVNELQEHTLI